MVLETERLSLHELTATDAEFMFEVLNDPGFIRFVADRGIRTTADAAAYIEEKIAPSYAKFGFGFWRVDLKESGESIGICGLAKRDTLEWPDVGFSILAAHSGKGYAYEAAAATMKFGYNTLRLISIIGITAPGNDASIHLLQKLGLEYLGKTQLPGYGDETLIFG
ncbi:MAG: GNAT family N-acetyltransferase [Chthoniobacterales bacterium]